MSIDKEGLTGLPANIIATNWSMLNSMKKLIWLFIERNKLNHIEELKK